MPLYGSDQVSGLLADIAACSPCPQTNVYRIFLLIGERYLRLNAAQQIEAIFLNQGGALHLIDGEQEELRHTLAKLRHSSLLPGYQIHRVNDARLFHAPQSAQQLWDRALKAHAAGKEELACQTLCALLVMGDIEAHEQALSGLSNAKWQQLFSFPQPQALTWTKSYLHNLSRSAPSLASTSTESAPAADSTQEMLHAGVPAANLLLLLVDEANRRTKLFKHLQKEHTVIDLSVESGASARAEKQQKTVLLELARATLREQRKTIANADLAVLLERVGFHPVALVNELRKLMLASGEQARISRDDLDALVGRTNQEALFELSNAISKGKIEEALYVGQRLQLNGIHPLAMIAVLRTFVRNLLLFKALQADSVLGYQPRISAKDFQERCLPILKEKKQWKKELSGHPFALYKQFATASLLPLERLCEWMRLLLEAEYRLKSAATPPELIVHRLLWAMLMDTEKV